ncbi:MAG: YihY/virulence factor BrkB family protein [Opitutaceae bacterium]
MAHSGKPAQSLRERFRLIRPRLRYFWHKEIWLSSHLKDSSPRGILYACLRVVLISWTVFKETKAASRAAALSFSSLLGLGPLVALTVMIAGFALEKSDAPGANIAAGEVRGRNKVAVDALGRLINFVAPQLGQYQHARPSAEPTAPEDSDAALSSATPQKAPPGSTVVVPPPATLPVVGAELSPNAPAPVNPKLLELLDNFISGARSGSAGIFGIFTLILIVLLLFKTVEDTFNEIWGVRSGRSLIMRVVYYWTVLTLGAVLFFASVTLLGAGAFISVFKEATQKLPFSAQMAVLLQWSVPAFSFSLLVVLLTAFYRVIPNTRVYWRAAFMGAVVVAALLMLNNFLAFLYVKRVILEESLYGSLGILPVLMFGLYIFWLYVLIGGQISYAVQNVHFRNSQAAWSSLTETMRERLSLLALLTICRRFQACLPPVSASELSTMIKVPTQILNECINRLVDIKLVTPVPPPPDAATTELLYQPSRPLNRVSLGEFKRLDDNLGDAPAGVALEGLDPILNRYDAALDRLSEQPFFQKNLEELFAEFAFDGPRSPSNPAETRK